MEGVCREWHGEDESWGISYGEVVRYLLGRCGPIKFFMGRAPWWRSLDVVEQLDFRQFLTRQNELKAFGFEERMQ